MANSLERALVIVRELASRPRTITELAARFGVDRTTISRTLKTLESEGFVRRGHDSTYTLGFGLLGLAHGGFDQVELRKAAYTPIRQLQQITRTTVHLAQLDGNTVIYIDKAESLDGVGLYARIGQPLPLYCTAVGKVILASVAENRLGPLIDAQEWVRYTERTLPDAEHLIAQLETVRAQGWATDDREFDELVNCVAVPILGNRSVIGAISVTALHSVCTLADLAAHVPIMRRMASTVQASMPLLLSGD